MLLAALHGVEKFYGEQVVLENATLEIRTASRLALIGRNGAGKSTLLRLLMESEAPDGGWVYKRDGVSLAMLEQDPYIDAGRSVLEVSEGAFTDLDRLEGELARLEAQGLDRHEVYERWEALHEVFERRGGYERRARRDSVLYALGFRGREHETASHLSGGEKTRLGLARLLMAQPDVLLLDEPTNHLDMEMREWLEGYLGRYPGGVLLVSHDRAFLDQASNSTAEIALGILRTFDGTPSRYREARAEQLAIEAATRKNQQQELARLDAAASRMKQWAGQNEKLHRRAKAMEKRVDRYQAGMIGEAERKERTTRFRFDSEPSGEIVLQAAHLSKGFGDTDLFENVRFTVRSGERIALVGPNGAGKSTFLKVVLGNLASDNPKATLDYGARVRVGYYDQELRGVNPENTLIEEMIRMVGDKEAHNLLGRFLFPYDAQFKRIADLSGGERARLALLKLTLGEYNFLVLDEPTNHLDVEMIEALEDALADYTGTLLVVSHDRRFIQATTSLIWEVRGGQFEVFEGDWSFYQRKRRERMSQDQEARATQETSSHKKEAAKPEKKTPSKWQLGRDSEALESEIEGLETTLTDITAKLAKPEQLKGEEIAELGEEHARLEAELLEKMAQWEEVTEMLSEKV